jgi:hypothetical protein
MVEHHQLALIVGVSLNQGIVSLWRRDAGRRQFARAIAEAIACSFHLKSYGVLSAISFQRKNHGGSRVSRYRGPADAEFPVWFRQIITPARARIPATS